jgi:DNA-binding NarL/FixJ family response regulator
MEPVRVVLVDDSATFLAIAARFLTQQKDVKVVGAATDGAEAVAMAESTHPDVLLVDLAMPGVSGLEAIPRIREVLPAVGIVALTLMDSTDYREAALSAGADDFVAKADLTQALVPSILRVARAHQRGTTHLSESPAPELPRRP